MNYPYHLTIGDDALQYREQLPDGWVPMKISESTILAFNVETAHRDYVFKEDLPLSKDLSL